jgi:O-antigen ligase
MVNLNNASVPIAAGRCLGVAKKKKPVISSALFLFAYGAGFSGFQLLLLGIHLRGIGHASRSLTVPYHAVFLGLSILFIFYAIARRVLVGLGWLWVPLLTFWLLYFVRIAIDGYLQPVPLFAQPAIEYFQKALGIAFVPMFMFLARTDADKNRLAFRSFWAVHVTCLVLSVLFYRRFIEDAYRSLRYYGVDVSMLLSPILLSYIGIIASAVSFELLLNDPGAKRTRTLLFTATILVLGLVLMFQGGTRSSLIALVGACIVIGYSSLSTVSIRRAISIIIIILFVGAIFYPMIRSVESGMVERFSVLREEIAFGDPLAGGGRLDIYRQALKQIVSSPFLGSGLEVQESMAAAHNNVLEAFLATGVIGGICFIILVSVGFLRSVAILKRQRPYGWIASIFLVALIRGLFSFSIIDPALWFSMLALMVIPMEPKRRTIRLGYPNLRRSAR